MVIGKTKSFEIFHFKKVQKMRRHYRPGWHQHHCPDPRLWGRL